MTIHIASSKVGQPQKPTPPTAAGLEPGTETAAVPGEYIIGFKPGVSHAQQIAVIRSLSPIDSEPLSMVNGLFVRVDPQKPVSLTPPGAGASPISDKIAWIQPNYLHFIRDAQAVSKGGTDPGLTQQYHLENFGQTGGTKGVDIKATDAWRTSTGKDVIVAVADTNIDINHPDVKGNIWVNAKEVAGNGVDDDANGFVDDVNGWNFSANNNRPEQGGQSHGTHVAGIIGAVAGNDVGGSGVAPGAKIMPLNILNSSTTTANAIKAWQYAVQNGAHIISNSWGNNRFEPALAEAVAKATQAGTMIVVAAGNENWDTGVHGSYPDNYAGSVSIAASDHNDRKASYSNRGVVTIDVAAPGDAIHSTLPSGGYGKMSGTSMAAPVYAGVAALVKSRFPHLTMKEVEKRIAMSAQVSGTAAPWNSLVANGGRIDAAAALLPLAKVSDLTEATRKVPAVGEESLFTWKSDVKEDQRFDVEASYNASAQSTVDEGFESDVPSRNFKTYGDTKWKLGRSVAKSGSGSFMVEGVGREQRSILELSETLTEPTEISFWYRGGRGGELSFFINRDLQFAPTGDENWREFKATLPAGQHTFTWHAGGRGGSGTMAIDDLKIGKVSDAVWEKVGEAGVGESSFRFVPTKASSDVQLRVRSDNAKAANDAFKGDWATSEKFAVNK